MSNTTNSTVKQFKELPGVMTCVLEHEVKSTKATLKWEGGGPKLNAIWPQVLAFFKWTYTEHKSESQVRLFVNNQTREWAAWAFPQEARTGMSAREIEGESASRQREAFSDQEGWTYFGTVHHHCGAGAFQSGTDENNEKNQDGLHITVGKMDEAKHDLHARLYISGHKFEPDMSWFWDVEPLLAQIPEGLRQFMSVNMEDKLAREQMCIPVPEGTEFPEQWRENVIEVQRPVITTPTFQGGLGYSPGSYGSTSVRRPWNTPRDLWNACTEFRDFFEECTGVTKETITASQWLSELVENTMFLELTEILYRNEVGLEELAEKVEDVEQKELARELKQSNKKSKTEDGPQSNGVPDYQGEGWSDYGHMQ